MTIKSRLRFSSASLACCLALLASGCLPWPHDRTYKSLKHGSVRVTIHRHSEPLENDELYLSSSVDGRQIVARRWLGPLHEPVRFRLIQVTETVVGLIADHAPKKVYWFIETASGHFLGDRSETTEQQTAIWNAISNAGYEVGSL